MIIYYAIIALAVIGGGFFYGGIIAQWAKDMWTNYFSREDE